MGTAPSPGTPGRVIECNLYFILESLDSRVFIVTPSILDDIEVPAAAYGDPIDTTAIAKGTVDSHWYVF